MSLRSASCSKISVIVPAERLAILNIVPAILNDFEQNSSQDLNIVPAITKVPQLPAINWVLKNSSMARLGQVRGRARRFGGF